MRGNLITDRVVSSFLFGLIVALPFLALLLIKYPVGSPGVPDEVMRHHVRYWPIAGMGQCTAHVAESGHGDAGDWPAYCGTVMSSSMWPFRSLK
jgi:hypothetical protein